MNVLLTGGDGFVGQHLCSALVDRGHNITILSRNPDASVLPDGVAIVTGDITEYDTIADAFEGQDAVVNLVALSPLYQPPEGTTHIGVHLEGTLNAVRAAEEHAVERFVQMSALNANSNGPTSFLRAKGAAEEVVRRARLDQVIVRPSVVFGDGGEFVGFSKKVTTPYVTVLPDGGSTTFQPVWVNDLASMLADAVEDDTHAEETYEIGGPEELTLATVTHLIYQSEEKSTTIYSIPMPVAEIGLSALDPVSFIPFGIDQARSLQTDTITEDNDVEAFGISESELTSLSAYLGVG